MKSLIITALLTLSVSSQAIASSCYSGYKEGQDPDKYYAPDGTEFDSSRECVKYAKSLNEPAKDKEGEED